MAVKSKPILFGKTEEMIFQIIHRAAISLSTNDVYQRLRADGLFLEIPAIQARKDIAAKLLKLKPRGVISVTDAARGSLWQLDPDVLAKLPRETDPLPAVPAKTSAKPLAAPRKAKSHKPSMIQVDIPADKALIWAEALNDLSYYDIIKQQITDMFAAIETHIRRALPQEAA